MCALAQKKPKHKSEHIVVIAVADMKHAYSENCQLDWTGRKPTTICSLLEVTAEKFAAKMLGQQDRDKEP